jgi:hypothetical protein
MGPRLRGDDEWIFLRGLRVTFVNAMFTTFVRVRFTNVFDDTVRIAASACVWRACIAG